MRKFEQIIFFLLLTTIPIQLGKHFWPHFSFVDGIRVDYLSPTVYFTDVLLLILFLVSIPTIASKFLGLLKNRLLSGFLVVIFFSTLFAYKPEASLLGVLVFVKVLFFSFYVSQKVSLNNLREVIFFLTIGAFFEIGLLVLQLLNQGSVGGLFYYFGERTFSASTPGIALFNLNGSPVMRPYGTFPHPNVSAFYLFIVLSLNLFFQFRSNIVSKVIKIILMFILFLGISITFSRIVVLLSIVAFFYYFLVARGVRGVNIVLASILSSLIVIILFVTRSSGVYMDLMYRLELVIISIKIFLNSPVLGVGLNNFFYYQIDFQKDITPTLLQPVHNIYLWVLSSLGVSGFAIMFLFVKEIYRRSLHFRPYALVIVCMLAIGFFDHYLLTLHQGQLMTGFVLGLIYSKTRG